MKEIIKKIFTVDKKTLYFLEIISIIGIITGALYMIVLTQSDKEVIKNSLEEFLNNINNVVFLDSFKNNMIINILYIIIIWILGISIIGLPIVIFLVFIKSFVLSFSFTSFILNYKGKGIIYAVLYNLPHQLINLFIYIYIGTYAIRLSLAIINSIIYRKNINFKNVINKYLKVLLISFLVILLSTLYESYLMPLAFKKILTML